MFFFCRVYYFGGRVRERERSQVGVQLPDGALHYFRASKYVD